MSLNCNLHPLEIISSKTRKILTDYEKQHTEIVNITECLAWRIIAVMNSLGYSNKLGLLNVVWGFIENKIMRAIEKRNKV